MKRLSLILILALVPLLLSAQFYTIGTDPVRSWKHNKTTHYNIIYPVGCDSIAKVYSEQLEKAYYKVALTTRYFPSEKWIFKKVRTTPVVLHPYTSYSNGSVGISPVRMDLLSMGSPYDRVPLPWSQMLSIHESRHLSQVQAGMDGWLRVLNYIFGEGGAALPVGLYQNSAFIEGDAVIQETAWTQSGRGRTADFLNYYRIAFDSNDDRTFWHWFHGSAKYYTPDKYAFGYLNLASWRAMYDDPFMMAKMVRQAHRSPFNLSMMNATLKNMAGKNSNKHWPDVAEMTRERVRKEIAARGPFLEGETVVKGNVHEYTTFTGGVVAKNFQGREYLYTIRYKFSRPWQLVRVDLETGSEKVIRQFAYESSPLSYDPENHLIYWSEKVTASTQSLTDYSRIFSYNPLSPIPTVKCMTPGKVYYFNPTPYRDGVIAVEFTPGNKTAVVELDGKGKVVRRIAVPNAIQATETVYNPETGDILMLGLNDCGYAVYKLTEGEWKPLWKPQHVVIANLSIVDGELYFTSDRNGEHEVYAFKDGDIYQLTSSRYGSNNYSFSADRKSFYYTSNVIYGHEINRVNPDSLLWRPVDVEKTHKWFLADKMAEQEKIAWTETYGNEIPDSAAVEWAPRKYWQSPRLFKIHTWLPVYVDPSVISSVTGGGGGLSFDSNIVTLGATAFFQNDLGTSSGAIQYSAHKDPYFTKKWRHAAKANWSYTGLPVHLSVDFSFNDRSAMSISQRPERLVGTYDIKTPAINGSITASVPYVHNSRGWMRGFTPRISYSICNDLVDRNERPEYRGPYVGGRLPHHKPQYTPLQTLTASVAFHTHQLTPRNALFPRFGFDAQAGVIVTPGTTDIFSHVGYVYGDIYLPFFAGQGFKISALAEIPFLGKPYIASSVGTLPRGINKAGGSMLLVDGDVTVAATIDWAIPINVRGWNLWDLFYIYKFKLNPFFDYSEFGLKRDINLCSAGMDAVICFKRFFLNLNLAIGIRYSYNFGSGFNDAEFATALGLTQKDHHRVAPVIQFKF